MASASTCPAKPVGSRMTTGCLRPLTCTASSSRHAIPGPGAASASARTPSAHMMVEPKYLFAPSSREARFTVSPITV